MNINIQFDGYSDGVDMDLTRTSEQLHFVDTYDKLQALHSAEKMRMVKKIQTAYKNIGNTNVSNSVESYCNNTMSTEGIITNIKEKLVEYFKRFCEFIKKCIMKFRMLIIKKVGVGPNKRVYNKNTRYVKHYEKIIEECYKINSEIVTKLSHSSQISQKAKSLLRLQKKITDTIIDNMFLIFKITINDAKLESYRYDEQQQFHDYRLSKINDHIEYICDITDKIISKQYTVLDTHNRHPDFFDGSWDDSIEDGLRIYDDDLKQLVKENEYLKIISEKLRFIRMQRISYAERLEKTIGKKNITDSDYKTKINNWTEKKINDAWNIKQKFGANSKEYSNFKQHEYDDYPYPEEITELTKLMDRNNIFYDSDRRL